MLNRPRLQRVDFNSRENYFYGIPFTAKFYLRDSKNGNISFTGFGIRLFSFTGPVPVKKRDYSSEKISREKSPFFT